MHLKNQIFESALFMWICSVFIILFMYFAITTAACFNCLQQKLGPTLIWACIISIGQPNSLKKSTKRQRQIIKIKTKIFLKKKRKLERTVREKKFKFFFNLIYFFITSALSPPRSLSVFLPQILSSSLFLSLSVSISQIYFFII